MHAFGKTKVFSGNECRIMMEAVELFDSVCYNPFMLTIKDTMCYENPCTIRFPFGTFLHAQMH